MSTPHDTDEQEMVTATFAVPGFEDIIEAVRNRDAVVTQNAFDAGFKKGWSEAFKQIQQLAQINSDDGSPKLIAPTIQMGGGTLVMHEPDGTKIKTYHTGGKPIGTKDIVKNGVRRWPGIRGVDLVARLGDEGYHLNERTIRTALHRLKQLNEIKIVDGRWYTPQSAPPDPHSHRTEEDDDAAAS